MCSCKVKAGLRVTCLLQSKIVADGIKNDGLHRETRTISGDDMINFMVRINTTNIKTITNSK